MAGITAEQREAILDDVKDFLKGFGKNYASNYKTAVVNKSLEAAGGEEGGEEEGSARQLLSRPAPGEGEEAPNPSAEPVRVGTITKRGAVRKNWKQRYFVVRGDYKIEYYEDEEKYKAGGKPKGTMVLEGYEIVREPNARKMEYKREQNAKFKIEEEVPEYTKYEPLTLECYHATRRRWLLKFEDQASFDSWAATFEEAAARCSAKTLTDPLRIEAFEAAFDDSRGETEVKKTKVYGGSETDMLTDLLYDHVEIKHLAGVWTTLPGSGKMQKVAGDKLAAAMRGTINATVVAQWAAMNKTLDVSQDKIKAAIDKGVAPVAQAKANAMDAVKGKVDSTIAPVREKTLAPLAKKLADRVRPKIEEVFDLAVKAFEEPAKAFVGAGGDEGASKSLAKAVQSRKVLEGAFAAVDQAAKVLAKASDALPEGLGEKISFESLGLGDWLAEAEELVRTLLDNASYTLEQEEEKNDAAVASTMEKAKADAKLDAQTALSSLLQIFLSPVLKDQVMAACEPLVGPIDEHIPEMAQEFLSASGCLEEVLDEVAGNVADAAAGGEE